MHVSLKPIVIIGAVLLLTWTSATQAREAVIGYSGRTIAEMPFAWASRKGFFKEANLDVKMIYMSTSIAAKGLMSGDVDYSTAMGGALRAAIAGAPVIGVYSMFKAQMYLVAQPRYKQVADLKGKTVGISVFGGAYDLVARTILKHHGIDPERQAMLLQIGDSRTLYSALSAGTIDSAILGPPYDIKAELDGNNRLFDSSEIFDMPFSGLATSKKKLQQDRAEVKAIVRGLERIRRYIVANRGESEAFVKQFLNLNDQEARLSVAQMIKSFRDTGRTTDDAVVDFIDTTLRSTKQKVGNIKPGDIVDWSVTTEVVRELDKEKK
jgi:ABC-type nitrate/sulfonate/bicarbonate transport system substrate-binding protein